MGERDRLYREIKGKEKGEERVREKNRGIERECKRDRQTDI